jgi:hypothetical protein
MKEAKKKKKGKKKKAGKSEEERRSKNIKHVRRAVSQTVSDHHKQTKKIQKCMRV